MATTAFVVIECTVRSTSLPLQSEMKCQHGNKKKDFELIELKHGVGIKKSIIIFFSLRKKMKRICRGSGRWLHFLLTLFIVTQRTKRVLDNSIICRRLLCRRCSVFHYCNTLMEPLMFAIIHHVDCCPRFPVRSTRKLKYCFA